MFAPAYMGRKRVLRMLSLHVHGLLLLTAVCAVSESVGRAAPRHPRPMYAWANMGHPSREEGFVLCSTSATPSNSSGLTARRGRLEQSSHTRSLTFEPMPLRPAYFASSELSA